MNGIIIVDKEKGLTSQDVITKIKRILKVKKIGHAGTLDPLATGVLIVLVNEATKLSDYLMADFKEYDCEIVIGKATDTEDVMGEIIEEKQVFELKDVDEVLASLIGDLQQIPPMYSSVHHEGKKLYELARSGITVEREARNVHIYDIKRTSDVKYENDVARFSFVAKVSKGTYIRTLCVEIGKRLNYPAMMNELRRLSSGSLKIEDASTIQDIENNNYHIINMMTAFKDRKVFEVSPDLEKKVKNGMKVLVDCQDDMIIFTKDNQLLAIYEKENEIYRAKRIWN